MTTKDLLFDLINKSQPNGKHALTGMEVSFSDPSLDITTIRNSVTTLTALPGSGFKGSVLVHYSRESMGNLGLPTQQLQETPYILQGILDFLNQHLLVQITVDDIEPITIPSLNVGDILSIQLVAKTNSLAWIGSLDVQLLYGLPPNVDDVSTVFNTSLPHGSPPV